MKHFKSTSVYDCFSLQSQLPFPRPVATVISSASWELWFPVGLKLHYVIALALSASLSLCPPLLELQTIVKHAACVLLFRLRLPSAQILFLYLKLLSLGQMMTMIILKDQQHKDLIKAVISARQGLNTAAR